MIYLCTQLASGLVVTVLSLVALRRDAHSRFFWTTLAVGGGTVLSFVAYYPLGLLWIRHILAVAGFLAFVGALAVLLGWRRIGTWAVVAASIPCAWVFGRIAWTPTSLLLAFVMPAVLTLVWFGIQHQGGIKPRPALMVLLALPATAALAYAAYWAFSSGDVQFLQSYHIQAAPILLPFLGVVFASTLGLTVLVYGLYVFLLRPDGLLRRRR